MAKNVLTNNPCLRTNDMGYYEWHLWAEKQYRTGSRQHLCATCFRWKFPSERCELFVCAAKTPKQAEALKAASREDDK